ncbi:hypothetical protein [Iodobacter fluviatilis]|uniref:Uncharacterized protein n=1 Tax=Iodobacter fluviatilis TaxID=537 RepID=A0A377Q2D2_9NEIS|nr:hypothetical protein [Iodobacter fluviatilis]TCU90076.1 hypothetical protein EV682_10195 [Iodobacter fluviatilis]STQ89103.1 Uncharacterised protein [Iodobacter fluviatilis]
MPALKAITCRYLLFTLLLSMALPAAAAGKLPTHFGDKMEAALSCRSEWSNEWWRSYFRQYLGDPLRVWGEAEWFEAQNASLGGNKVSEVFVSLPSSGALMVGALIPDQVETVRKNIEASMGFAFVPLAGSYPRFLSKFGSVLVGLPNNQSKWYCARWNLGNRP